GGAYVYFEEDTKGILKAGAQADFVVLSEDPTAVGP
ncbi:MAG: amidohydrolase family protein, partial [Oscillospiraceae bacterium]|nr:amidohydrolase family protein [Oscillospiraceae bacterium]